MHIWSQIFSREKWVSQGYRKVMSPSPNTVSRSFLPCAAWLLMQEKRQRSAVTPRSGQGERPCGVCRHLPLSYGYSKAASTLSMLSGAIATLQTTLRLHGSSRYTTCSKQPELGQSNSILRYQTFLIRYDLSWRKPVDRTNDQLGPQDSTLAERISKNSLRQIVLKSRGRGGWWELFLQRPQNSKNISSYLCLFC